MRIILSVFLSLVCFSSGAGLRVSWTTDSPVQVMEQNVFVERVNLNLFVGAELNYNDDPGIKVVLGYDFTCQGDEAMFKNQNQRLSADPEVMYVSLKFEQDTPLNWTQWSSGMKTCVLKWTASGIRTQRSGGGSLAFNVSGRGSSIAFNYSPVVASMVEEEKIGPVTVPFTMIKPDQASGSFCEGNFE